MTLQMSINSFCLEHFPGYRMFQIGQGRRWITEGASKWNSTRCWTDILESLYQVECGDG